MDHHLISVFTSVDHATKQRFLRVLDLSLRSATLPSKLVASFVKRLARVLVSTGVVIGVNDTMFVLSLMANLIKRHPRSSRLIHRKKTSMSMGKRLASDPFLASETDPLSTKALKSSLWEVEILMRKHHDMRVRDFTKMFKTNFTGKCNFFKAEEFIQYDALSALHKDLEEMDTAKIVE